MFAFERFSFARSASLLAGLHPNTRKTRVLGAPGLRRKETPDLFATISLMCRDLRPDHLSHVALLNWKALFRCPARFARNPMQNWRLIKAPRAGARGASQPGGVLCRDDGGIFGMVRKAVEKQNWSIGEMKDVSQLRVYSYQFLDDLSFIHKPSDVPIFYDMKPGELDQFVDAVRRLFLAAGWEGDGDLGILWLPPFVDVGIEDTWGTYVWHVKQSNNGTSWLASSAPLRRV